MAETIEIGGSIYEITGYASDGLPIIQGVATSTEDGVDELGNKRVSVNITIPVAVFNATPGENGG